MSVSIVAIPVVITMRVVMGKKGFENWAASMELVKETSFINKEELLVTIKQCGYSMEPYGNIFKTKFTPQNYLFWSYRDDKWVAVFNKHVDEVSINKFMDDLEQKAKRPIFKESSNSKVVVQNFPTNFQNLKLLKKVLDSNSISFQEQNNRIICHLEIGELIFSQPAVNEAITVEVLPQLDMEHLFNQLVILDEEYKMNVQEHTYQTLLEKAHQKGFAVEQEEFLADNSIVLTLNVRA